MLGGHAARTALGRALVHANEAGATRREVERAVERRSVSRSPEAFLGERAEGWMRLSEDPAPLRLALEMAPHEETERRALHGELALLEAAWRQAEEIAAIADRLALHGTTLPEEPGSTTRTDDMRKRER